MVKKMTFAVVLSPFFFSTHIFHLPSSHFQFPSIYLAFSGENAGKVVSTEVQRRIGRSWPSFGNSIVMAINFCHFPVSGCVD